MVGERGEEYEALLQKNQQKPILKPQLQHSSQPLQQNKQEQQKQLKK